MPEPRTARQIAEYIIRDAVTDIEWGDIGDMTEAEEDALGEEAYEKLRHEVADVIKAANVTVTFPQADGETTPLDALAEAVHQELAEYGHLDLPHLRGALCRALFAYNAAHEAMVLRAAAEDLGTEDCSGACEDGQPCDVDTGVRWLNARADHITREDAKPHA